MKELEYGLYIHVPFCTSKCSYCNFYAIPISVFSTYDTSVINEWKNRQLAWPLTPHTIFIGGGSPSLLKTTHLKNIIKNINTCAQEISIEINPEHAKLKYILDLKQLGISRVSLGVQSFNNNLLKFLNRSHEKKTILNAISNISMSNFKSVSIDIIIGLEKTINTTTLEYCINKINHISIYPLQIKQLTPLNRKKRIRNIEENSISNLKNLNIFFKKYKILQYELSNFAQKNHECIHNKSYWDSHNYIGLGPSAHSMKTLPDGSRLRSHNSFDIQQYTKSQKLSFYEEYLSPKESFLESCWIGLRNLQNGINLSDILNQHKLPIQIISKILLVLKSSCLETKYNVKFKKSQYGYYKHTFYNIMKMINSI